MEEHVVQIARDPFARASLMRRVEKAYHGCAWCGQRRKNNKLFQYGWETDSWSGLGPRWEPKMFCSKDCHDTYYEER